MPSPFLGPAERDAIYEFALDHVDRIGRLRLAIMREDFETARQYGLEFSDELVNEMTQPQALESAREAGS